MALQRPGYVQQLPGWFRTKGMLTGVGRRRVMVLAAFAGLGTVLLNGCSQEIPGESREPRCEARLHTAPGRLNIDTGAEDFGIADPCRATISFFIARNTPLREVEAAILFTGAAGTSVGTEQVRVWFGEPDGGMYSEEVSVTPVEDHSCRSLVTRITELVCRDAQGGRIDCPSVALQTSYVFEDFTIDTGGLDVCFD